MKKIFFRTSEWLWLAVLLTFLAGSPRAQEQWIVFGDSLCDAGNTFAATGEASRPPFLSVPAAPYSIGGHHFSNGSTWVELLAVYRRNSLLSLSNVPESQSVAINKNASRSVLVSMMPS